VQTAAIGSDWQLREVWCWTW